MNVLFFLSLLGLLCAMSSLSHALEHPTPLSEDMAGCLARGEAIQHSLVKLVAHGEQQHLTGLQAVLEPLDHYCDTLHFEQNPPLRNAEYQVMLRQMELDAAEQYGDPQIIDKRRARLTHALQVLQYALGAKDS